MRILSIVGNRPQFIKSAPLSLALRDRAEEVVLHTGQHYDHDLSQVFFDELGLEPPKHRLEAGSGSHAEQIARMLPGIEAAVLEEQPGIVLVYGDTNSTLAGALAASKLRVPIAHVEAGLRSFDRAMPEELNRVLVDRVSSLLFAPSETAVSNLKNEGITDGVHDVGDVMLDANLRLAPIARERSEALELAGVEAGGYALVTVHREANTREPALGRIVEGLNALEEPMVFPLHPRTAGEIESQGLQLAGHVRPGPPAGYLDFAALASQARVILTDSGGVQKEAYWYEVPCVTLRENTEWVETVEAGWNRLVGTDPSAIATAAREARPGAEHPPLYGDGHAADLIADVLCTMDHA
ncbi:MAG TPA: UDP-N-acetylglucosamine 2-epimerase (non-hydrolyzing) [Gaiellaceae bacterium]|jgi:UDP-N-acetylglucosamine 2-epimerase|nr:UDP-N-acetylglucosamine 2-epimerase (non-hydrolyzing) [Gaiellaceae bacterium]